jgi:hypothetical protein
LDQKHEQLQGQALQPNRDATAAELKATVIQQKIVEANLLLRQKDNSHVTGIQKFCTASLAVSSPSV